MVLTENQNIYEGIIHSENCKSLECKYDFKLSKVDTSYKFKEIVQINIVGRECATNYGLTTDNKLIRTSDLSMANNILLLIYTYATITPSGYFSNNGKITSNPLQVSIYENVTLKIGNYNENFDNTNSYYDILKEDGTKIVAKQRFTTSNCDTFILGIDNYLYKTNLNSCDGIINENIKVKKYTDKIVKLIQYGVSIDQANTNVTKMSMKQMKVVVEPLNINIQYEDGSVDLFQIDRNVASGDYYIIFEN